MHSFSLTTTWLFGGKVKLQPQMSLLPLLLLPTQTIMNGNGNIRRGNVNTPLPCLWEGHQVTWDDQSTFILLSAQNFHPMVKRLGHGPGLAGHLAVNYWMNMYFPAEDHPTWRKECGNSSSLLPETKITWPTRHHEKLSRESFKYNCEKVSLG